MIKVDIKPLSVNRAWKGRRFRTDEYKKYSVDLCRILPAFKVPKGRLYLIVEWGFSSASSDTDNPLKCFIDCLQTKYKFNDKMIKKITVEAMDVKKGDEYIKFDIKKLPD